jgi:hypothetical protein
MRVENFVEHVSDTHDAKTRAQAGTTRRATIEKHRANDALLSFLERRFEQRKGTPRLRSIDECLAGAKALCIACV